MSGEEVFFLVVVWVLGSVPLSLLMGGVIGFGAKTAEVSAPAPTSARIDEAA